MSNAQTWAIIGTLATVVVALTAGTLATVRSELRALRAELRGDIAVLTTRVEHIDRDVQNLVNRRFEGPAA